MSFAQVFFDEVVSRYQAAGGTVPLYFNQADRPTRPFCVVLIVGPATETPAVLCRDTGEGGELTLQFSLAADAAITAYSTLVAIKDITQRIKGLIGPVGNRYRIYGNQTDGVTAQDAQLGGWSCTFDTTVWWDQEAT